MTRVRPDRKRRSPVPGLRARLDEAEATLDAIRTGKADAVVVSGPEGDRTVAIGGATHPYHVLLDAMNDGAALLRHDGTMLFGNRRLGEMAGRSVDELRGSRFQALLLPRRAGPFGEMLRRRRGTGEFAISAPLSSPMPVWIAVSTVAVDVRARPPAGRSARGATVLMAIVTDLRERKGSEATRLGLMTRLLSAEDDERRRIARELHDETGQSLTALLVGLRAIEDRIVKADARATVRRLRAIAAQTMDNVGRLARGLHPAVLDDVGLLAAVRRHVGDYRRTFNIDVALRCSPRFPTRFSPLVQTMMYRVLQEALTNVARHARARHVGVALKHGAGGLGLVVQDDGVGFDVAAAFNEGSGLGLHGMRERAALLGGSADIESRVGGGSVIRVQIPVAAAGRQDRATLGPAPRKRGR